MNAILLALITGLLPDAIALAKEAFAKENPDAPEPTEEQVMAAYIHAFTSSLAKDDAWLAAHPPTPPAPPTT